MNIEDEYCIICGRLLYAEDPFPYCSECWEQEGFDDWIEETKAEGAQ
jgi:hypothetical protein